MVQDAKAAAAVHIGAKGQKASADGGGTDSRRQSGQTAEEEERGEEEDEKMHDALDAEEEEEEEEEDAARKWGSGFYESRNMVPGRGCKGILLALQVSFSCR